MGGVVAQLGKVKGVTETDAVTIRTKGNRCRASLQTRLQRARWPSAGEWEWQNGHLGL